MSFAICIFLACCAIIALSLIPKKLTELESLFVFFSATVFELSLFTIVHVNLDWVIVPPGNEPSFANLVSRLVTIPVILVMTSHIMLYDWKWLKWAVIAGFVLLFVPMQFVQEGIGLIVLPHWNVYYTLVVFGSCIAFARVMAQLILNARPPGEGRS